MGFMHKATFGYKTLVGGKEAYSYYKIIKGALDEDTRTGALFKGAIKVSTAVAKKAIGMSIVSNPYFAYHKMGITVLANTMSAVETKNMTAEAFKNAVAAADSTSRVSLVLEGLEHRRVMLDWYWCVNIWVPMSTLELSMRNPAEAKLQAAMDDKTLETLKTDVAKELRTWRESWAELCGDSLELMFMVDAETRVAEAAFDRYKKKLTKLMESNSTVDRVAGHAAEQEALWTAYERLKNPSPDKHDQAVLDPVAFARTQRARTDRVAATFAKACDLVFNDVVKTPETFQRQYAAIFGL